MTRGRSSLNLIFSKLWSTTSSHLSLTRNSEWSSWTWWSKFQGLSSPTISGTWGRTLRNSQSLCAEESTKGEDLSTTKCCEGIERQENNINPIWTRYSPKMTSTSQLIARKTSKFTMQNSERLKIFSIFSKSTADTWTTRLCRTWT